MNVRDDGNNTNNNTAADREGEEEEDRFVPPLTRRATMRRARLVLADMLEDRGYQAPSCLRDWDEVELGEAIRKGAEGADWLVAEPRPSLVDEAREEEWRAWIEREIASLKPRAQRPPPPRPMHVAASGTLLVLFVQQLGTDALLEALEHVETANPGRALLVLPDELNAAAQKALAEWCDDQPGTVVETLLERQLLFNVARRVDGALAYRVIEDPVENRALHKKYRGTTPSQLYHRDPVSRYFGLSDCRGSFVRILYDSETAGITERTKVIT